MFVGHYAASLALKSVEKNASLGLLFLAVQFVDILFFPFVLLGIECMNIILWNNAVATYGLEALLLVGGLWLYLRATKGETMIGRYGMIGYVVVLLLVNGFNIFGPLLDDSVAAVAIPGLVFYFLFAGIAYWLDGKRR